MDRTRVFALGTGTLGVALGAGLMVQHMVPHDHPARNKTAWLEMTDEDICESELDELLGASVTAVAADLDAANALHGAMAGLGWYGTSVAGETESRPATMSMASVAAAASDHEPSPELRRPAASVMGMGIGWGLGFDTGTPEADEPARERMAAAAQMAPDMRPQMRAQPVLEPAAQPDPAMVQRQPDQARGCTPQLRLTAAPGAMIEMVLEAPCLPEARVVIRHAGLAVTGRTSALGQLEVALPALAEEAQVTVALPGPASVAARVAVPEVRDYDRVAVQWQGSDAFQLHAYEFGAPHGAPGHVSGADPAGPARAQDGIGGFLSVLGDSRTDWPLLAEVYSFPAGRLARTGAVELVLEAAVTEETCGRVMLGEALEMRRGARPVATDIDVTMPGCEAVGGFVMLKRLLGDLTLARN